MSTTASQYPKAARALRAPVEGNKRRRVLVSIAAFQDEGHPPALSEIAARAKLDDWRQAKALVKQLETDGLVQVEWVTRKQQRRFERNTYELLV